MKHIKKKFAVEIGTIDGASKHPNTHDVATMGKVSAQFARENDALLIHEDDLVIAAFYYNNNGDNITIPSFDPVIMYFHHAQSHLAVIETNRRALFQTYRADKVLTETVQNYYYAIYGAVCTFIIMLYTAWEAFINKQIPMDHVFKDVKNNRTEIYDYDQIQRHISFGVKIDKVLNAISKKDFMRTHSRDKQILYGLKDMRDQIVHTKRAELRLIPYRDLLKRILDYKCGQAIESVATFMNFYDPGYIEPCPCDADF